MQDFAHALMVLLSPVERLSGEVVNSKDTLLKEQAPHRPGEIL